MVDGGGRWTQTRLHAASCGPRRTHLDELSRGPVRRRLLDSSRRASVRLRYAPQPRDERTRVRAPRAQQAQQRVVVLGQPAPLKVAFAVQDSGVGAPSAGAQALACEIVVEDEYSGSLQKASKRTASTVHERYDKYPHGRSGYAGSGSGRWCRSRRGEYE